MTPAAEGSEDRGPMSVDAANAEALRRITAAEPWLVDLAPAGEMLPDLGARDLLHAGPPLAGWEEVGGALKGSIIGALVHLRLAPDAAAAEAPSPPPTGSACSRPTTTTPAAPMPASSPAPPRCSWSRTGPAAGAPSPR